MKTYELNSKIIVNCRDISDVNADKIPGSGIMLAGCPCQAVSSGT